MIALYILHVIVCFFLILVVLLQQGKGADLAVFGGGSTQTAFGARGAATLLHKLTVGAFVLFILTTMLIALLQTGGGNSSVLSGVETSAPVEAEVTPTEGDAADASSEAPAADDGETAAQPVTDGETAEPAAEPPGEAEGDSADPQQ